MLKDKDLKEIQTLIHVGKERGYVTYEEMNNALPTHLISAEELDDVMIMCGEWGRVEEIHLTYVVLKLWDERRLVVPITKFLEEPFQNWTRSTSALLGTVLWYLDPATDIDQLRIKLAELVKNNPKWDGRFFNMQVTSMDSCTIEVRALMTAANADKAFDLRCDVREGLLEFIRAEMPEALPRRRQLQVESEYSQVVAETDA